MSTLDWDILNPSEELEAHCCKKKRLVPNPRSEFVSLRCPGCMNLTTAFSHANVPVTCADCALALAFPTGGRIRLADGVDMRTRMNA
jgi:small subunit ribosomal protein S27e